MKFKSFLFLCLFAFPLIASAMEKPSFQFTHRLRIETWDNAVNMDDETGNPTTYTRQRSSLGLKWMVLPAAEFGLKMTHEFRYYISPKSTPFSRNEVVFDNLYLKWTAPTAMPLTLTAGRFNIWFGEGFIVADQSPLDGSRTGYFNAIKADVQIDPTSDISAFYCQMDRQDKALPVFNHQHQAMALQPEMGGGLYFQKKLGTNALHLYYLNFTQEKAGLAIDRKTNALGFRFEWKNASGLYATTENAAQWSSDDLEDRNDFAGLVKFGKEYSEPVWSLSRGEVGFIYYTKDWNPIWGRFPRWSESYIYTLVSEHGVAYWSNFSSIFAQATIVPSTGSKIAISYHHLGAFETNTPVWGDGKTRGNLFICRYDYKINPRLNGCFIAERFLPGDFYADGSNSYLWLRSELFYTFDLKL